MSTPARAGRALLVVLAVLGCGRPAAAHAETLVTLGFDDATSGQMAPAGLLDAVGLKGTFYVNTGIPGQPGRLSWAQVHDLAARGHEIAGHGVRRPPGPDDPGGVPRERLRTRSCRYASGRS